jgi:hypothetical protein
MNDAADYYAKKPARATAPAGTPGYWMYETTGVLAPVVKKYLNYEPLSDSDVATMRAYLRQWIMAPVWKGDAELAALRAAVNRIQTQNDISEWLEAAMEEGHDPL